MVILLTKQKNTYKNKRRNKMKKKLIIHNITDEGFVFIFGCESEDGTLIKSVPNPGIDMSQAIRVTGSNNNSLDSLWQFNSVSARKQFIKELKTYFELKSDGSHSIQPYLKGFK